MLKRTEPPGDAKAEREQKGDRLAAALRANLARRKAQKRAREAAPGPVGTGGAGGKEQD